MTKNKRGQVWIETVIYTMIAFILIATVLAFVRPKIQEMQDQAIIKQSIELLKEIDSTIISVLNGAPGNKRLIELNINEGTLKFDGQRDSIIFELETSTTYSEPGKNVTDGNIIIRTDKLGDENLVTLERNYNSSKYNLTNNNFDEIKSLSKGSTAYKVFISNLGSNQNKSSINIEIK
jgi:type II secretory pathway pseudopilin PulG